jgi:hypothetical protein
MTFNIQQIKEDMLKQNGGKLTVKMEHQINVLEKMDESGDGEISLLELIHMEENKEQIEQEASRMKKIICAIVLLVLFMLGCMMAMGVAAVEVTKESRVRGGTPVATSGNSATVAPKAASRRRLGATKRGLEYEDPWDNTVTYEISDETKTESTDDQNLAALYKAEEGMTAKEKKAKHSAEELATCTRCRDAIDAEIADGAVAPFDSLNTNLDCEYCPFCIFNAGGAVQVAPAKHCPTTTDGTDGTKKVLDTRGIAYGIGGEDFPISVTETCVKFMSQAIMDADASGTVTEAQANYQGYSALMAAVPTIPDGTPRSFNVDASTSEENFPGVKKITIKMPGDSNDVVLEGRLEVASTGSGFGDETQFIVPSQGPAVPEQVITIHAGGEISLNKAAQAAFVEAGQLSQNLNMNPDRDENVVTIPAMKHAYVVAEGMTSAVNMNANEVMASEPPITVGNMDTVKGEMEFPEYPAQISAIPPTVAQEIEYTEYSQCDHQGAQNPCTINDEGVEQYVTGEHTDANGVVHDTYSLFHAKHVSVTQDKTYMKIETMGETVTDDVSGVHMASSETLIIKNNPEGTPDQMLKEETMHCYGDMCPEFVEGTGAADAVVNHDGSITCGNQECVTGYEFKEEESIDRNQALPSCLPQVMGGATEMHETDIAATTRRLKQLYRKSGKIHPKNVKHVPHHLLAAHAFRQLTASVTADDLTMFESDNCIVVEYTDAGAATESSFSTEDQAVIANALPEERRRLRTHKRRLRRLTARRHINNRMAKHHRLRRLVRKVHLGARSIAKAHFNTRRRLMAMGDQGAEYMKDLDEVDAKAPKFQMDGFTTGALETANSLKTEMEEEFNDVLSANMYADEYYGTEAIMTPGGTYAPDPVAMAESAKTQMCGAVACSTSQYYTQMEADLKDLAEANDDLAKAEADCLEVMKTLTTKPAAEQTQYEIDYVQPALNAVNDMTYEVESLNATAHNSADSFLLDVNLYSAEEYLVAHMPDYVETEDAALKNAYDEKTNCAIDTSCANTPETFDVLHYLETGTTHAHEVDNPTAIYGDFDAIAVATLATEHVDHVVDALIDIGSNLEAATAKPSSLGYVSFDKTPAADGGLKMTRQHSTRTIPSTDAAYRRLEQHDYGHRRRLSRSTDTNRYSRGGDDRITEKTRERVRVTTDREREERGSGTSPVDTSMRRDDERMQRRPAERERSTSVIPNSRDSVRNERSETATASPATRRSRSTERTGRDVIVEREPEIRNCRNIRTTATDTCGGCTTNYRESPPSNARCYDICNEFNECERKKTTIAREVEKVSRERSVSVAPRRRPADTNRGSDRGSDSNSRPEPRPVQVRPREDPREDPRGDGGRGDGGRSTREDTRVRENAEQMINKRYETRPDPRLARKEKATETRGTLDETKERSSGRSIPVDPRIKELADSRKSTAVRERSNTTLDTKSAARVIKNPGKVKGSRREVMQDVKVVVIPRERGNPMAVTFERSKAPPQTATRQCPDGFNCESKKDVKKWCNTQGGTWDGRKWKTKTSWDEPCTIDPSAKPSPAERKASKKNGKKKGKRGRKLQKLDYNHRRRQLSMATPPPMYEDDMHAEIESYTCSHNIRDRMCFDLERDANGKLNAAFGDVENGEFRLFFELADPSQSKICLSIDDCGVVILDPVFLTGQATFPTKVAKRLANDCLDATGDAMMCCPGTGTMIRDIARSNGKNEFFVCDMSTINLDGLKSPIFDVDVTVREDTNSNSTVIEVSDMGHPPMHFTNGMSIDFHFMQEFYPTYETANKFCAGFDVSSMLSSFEPNCPECSMCENDGTDSICMKHANDALGCLYELEANCQFNNLTMECHSLPGDDNLPKTVSNDPLPCGAGQAYCGNTRTGEPMCVGEMQGKCMNCIDTSIVDDSRWGKRCSTPSGPMCANQGMFFCHETHQCVANCGYECQHNGNKTGIHGVGVTNAPILLGDPKTHVCQIPNPNVCHRLGQTFCEITQNCVDSCDAYACGQNADGTSFHQTVERRADEGVKFHSESNYFFQGNATTCKGVNAAICKSEGKKFCEKSFWDSRTMCVDNCNACLEYPATKADGTCVKPSKLGNTEYYCPANGTTGSDCATCRVDDPMIAPYNQPDSGNHTCYQDPTFQKPGQYRCSIQTGKLSIERDVMSCAMECHGYDVDSNNHYEKKVHKDTPGASPQRTCEQADKQSCVANGMVWCPNDQTAMENGDKSGECTMSCFNCYKPVRMDDVANMYTYPEIGHMPLPVNNSNTCTEQKDMRQECKNNNGYWCEGSQMCSTDCSDCEDTVEEWDWTNGWVTKTEQFIIRNEQEGTCDLGCPSVDRSVTYTYWWGTDGPRMESSQSIYCPLTKKCIVPDGYGSADGVVIDGDNMYGGSMNGNTDTSCSECGAFTMRGYTAQGNSVCKAVTKETCKNEGQRFCPTTHKCISPNECADKCPGMPFDPPHGPSHEQYDASSCMEVKANVTEKCTNTLYNGDWEYPKRSLLYCKDTWSTHCTETCDWCNKWTEDWTEIKSANDGSGFCSFQGVVTTHDEPMDDYIPEYNHTVTVEEDGTETEMWIEEPQNFSTYEDTSYTEVIDPWCPSSMSSVLYCDECGATTDMYYNWVGSSMIKDSSGTTCVWPENVYGCTDPNATNYDPHATALSEDMGETCPTATDMDYCYTCSYASYNNTAGYSMPEGTLDIYGMEMNFSKPDPAMYNYSYMQP